MTKIQNPLLIPSVEFNTFEHLIELRKYFKEFELNLFSTSLKRGDNRLNIINAIVKRCGMGIYSVHAPPFDISNPDVEEKKAGLAF
jgi:hypothetical protein